MNVELAQKAVATVGKFVCPSGADDENVAGAGLPLLIIVRPPGTAFNHVHNLIVFMPVQERSSARLGGNRKNEIPASPWSMPTNSWDIPTKGSCAR